MSEVTRAPGLKRARQSIGLSPEQLSETSGVGVEHIRNLESGGSSEAPAPVVEALRAYFATRHGFDIRERSL